MQAHILEVFILAKIVFYPNNKFPFMLPSHNCIIISQCSVFKVHLWISAFPRDSMKHWTSFLIHCFSQSLLEVVGQNGLEPSTSRLSVVCSSQLSYWPISKTSLVESTGIEPVTSCLQGRRSPSWANPPNPGILNCLGTAFSVPSKLNNVT